MKAYEHTLRYCRQHIRSRIGVLAFIVVLSCIPGHAEARVILLRGWFGVFSTGLDEIAEALEAKGIRAEVASHLYWKAAATEIVRERGEGKTEALVLVGHSQGANNVIDMAWLLKEHNVSVALLITLAPYQQNPLPSNVKRAINYYQSSGWGAPLSAEPDFQGKLSNIDVESDSTVSHINIDKSTHIQAEIEREIAIAVKSK